MLNNMRQFWTWIWVPEIIHLQSLLALRMSWLVWRGYHGGVWLETWTNITYLTGETSFLLCSSRFAHTPSDCLILCCKETFCQRNKVLELGVNQISTVRAAVKRERNIFSLKDMEVKRDTIKDQGCNHTLCCQKAELVVFLALQDTPHVQSLQKLLYSGFLGGWGEQEWCYIGHSFPSLVSYLHLGSWSLDATAICLPFVRCFEGMC